MTRLVAFLCGTNVGGVTLKMAEVAAVFEDAGFTAVKTIPASGNVLLDSDADATTVRRPAEQALRGEGVVHWQVPESATLDRVLRSVDSAR